MEGHCLCGDGNENDDAGHCHYRNRLYRAPVVDKTVSTPMHCSGTYYLIVVSNNTVCLHFVATFEFTLFLMLNLQRNKHQCMHRYWRRTLNGQMLYTFLCCTQSTRICCAHTRALCVYALLQPRPYMCKICKKTMTAIRTTIITMMLMRLGVMMTGVDNAGFVHKHAENSIV